MISCGTRYSDIHIPTHSSITVPLDLSYSKLQLIQRDCYSYKEDSGNEEEKRVNNGGF